MRKLLFILASTATFAVISPAIGQYARPGFWYWVGPRYMAPGYSWREQRLIEGWIRAPLETPQNPPNNVIGSRPIGVTDPYAGPGECAKGVSEETCQRRENTIGTDAYAGECSKGFSEETCRRRGQAYNPQN
jgi:hypothetical protein